MESSVPEKLDTKQRRAFTLARSAARQVLRRRFRVFRLGRDAYRKLSKNDDALREVGHDLRLLLRFSRAWAKREYRNVPWRTLLYSVAALVYFVNPADAIPDALLGLGFVDDVAVIGFVVGAIKKDLDRFSTWETTQARPTLSDAEEARLLEASYVEAKQLGV